MNQRCSPRLHGVGLLVFLLPFVVATSAQLGLRPAQEWIKRLEAPDRIARMKPDEVAARLRLKSGDVVADIGAGSGVFSRSLARAVAPAGIVLAVEIDPELLAYIQKRAAEESIVNIQPVRGEFDDPKLPRKDVDLVFICDALHHIEHRQAYLKALASSMKPGGRVAIIDRLEKHEGDPRMEMKQEDVKQWMEALGFRLTEEYYILDRNYFWVFERKPQ